MRRSGGAVGLSAVVLAFGLVLSSCGSTPEWQSKEDAQVSLIKSEAECISSTKCQLQSAEQVAAGISYLKEDTGQITLGSNKVVSSALLLKERGGGDAAQQQAYNNVMVDAVAEENAAELFVNAVDNGESQTAPGQVLLAGATVLKNDCDKFLQLTS
jgi:hypothetical protein